MDLKSFIRDIPDFPKKGILYRDIQPLLENPDAFFDAVMGMAEMVDDLPQYWGAIESRGFIFASALSMQYGGGVKLIRKAGKLPNTHTVLHSIDYDLEYGSATLEMEGGWGDIVIVDRGLTTDIFVSFLGSVLL